MRTIHIGFSLALVVAAAGLPAPGAPDVVAGLIGEWEGEGDLFGNPARFVMSWQWSLDERFVRLSFENRLVGSDGSDTTVLEAIAFYLVDDGNELRGHWFDTRGEIIELQATASDAQLVTRWISDSEEGRTTYRVVDVDTVTVTDEVLGDDGYRTFGNATYRRTSPRWVGPPADAGHRADRGRPPMPADAQIAAAG